MKILVTGGTGFVGSNLVLELMKHGHDITITGHDAEQKIPGFKGKYLQPGLHGIDWDEVGKVDVLFHQAAINDTTHLDRKEMLRANLEATKQLFEHVIKNGCRRIVYASSTAVYGNIKPPHREDGPVDLLNPYAESKKLVDDFAMQLAKEQPDLKIVGLRYCNVYGPREDHKRKRASMIYQLGKQMTKGDAVLFKDGEQKRDFVYVKDVVKANLIAAKAGESGIYNCGTGQATSYNEVVKILNKVLGVDRKISYIDNPYGGKFQKHTECDMTLAKQKLGFVHDFDIEKGISDYHESGFLV